MSMTYLTILTNLSSFTIKIANVVVAFLFISLRANKYDR